MSHRKLPTIPAAATTTDLDPDLRRLSWPAYTWISLKIVSCIGYIYFSIIEIHERSAYGARAIPGSYLQVVAAFLKVIGLVLLLMRRKAGWYTYLVSAIVVNLASKLLATYDLRYPSQSVGSQFIIDLSIY